MGIDEILDKIESYERKEKRNMKKQAVLDSVLADQIVNKISKMFDKDNDVENKHLWDYFPSMFESEKKLFEIEKEQEEFEMFKERRRSFAFQHNQRMKGGK